MMFGRRSRLWGDRGPRRLKMEGGAWPGVVLVEVTPSGVLVEAPAEPRIRVGMVGKVEIDGLCAQTVVEAAYPHTDPSKVFYAVSVVELDVGFLAALDGCAASRGVVLVHRSCPLVVASGPDNLISHLPEEIPRRTR